MLPVPPAVVSDERGVGREGALDDVRAAVEAVANGSKPSPWATLEKICHHRSCSIGIAGSDAGFDPAHVGQSIIMLRRTMLLPPHLPEERSTP